MHRSLAWSWGATVHRPPSPGLPRTARPGKCEGRPGGHSPVHRPGARAPRPGTWRFSGGWLEMRICKQTRNRHEAVTTRRAGAAILDTATPAHPTRPPLHAEAQLVQPGARSARGDAFRDVLAVAPGLLPFG